MTPIRMVFLTAALIVTVGTGYLGYRGIGGASTDLDRSIRVGSAGNALASSHVK
ncbi:MAG: hypothetical protein H6900_13505 [Rhodobacter sp.]|uniref:hypothetical protein n=1 Tax=Pararhodobacter sp. TaxID=2127056 RepID=UPI001DE2F8EE|nr:hypothetical protein [Pararhodobacter sp.]MCB1343946.1 hypothetical protein [Paracoccaceae bacterium]MCC0074294.1 hypothetical protein [Rhodobacter sp.]HPD91625.1 hypothetical protein [Pararhodobacter sp.]